MRQACFATALLRQLPGSQPMKADDNACFAALSTGGFAPSEQSGLAGEYGSLQPKAGPGGRPVPVGRPAVLTSPDYPSLRRIAHTFE